jgi:hypothetical protein
MRAFFLIIKIVYDIIKIQFRQRRKNGVIKNHLSLKISGFYYLFLLRTSKARIVEADAADSAEENSRP